jgi:hypothetical protein
MFDQELDETATSERVMSEGKSSVDEELDEVTSSDSVEE